MECLKYNSRFETLINLSKPKFDYNTTILSKNAFVNFYIDIKK